MILPGKQGTHHRYAPTFDSCGTIGEPLAGTKGVAMLLQWDKIKDIFKYDGRRKDIFVSKTNISDWELFIQHIAAKAYSVVYMRHGDPGLFEASDRDTPTHDLMIFVSGVALHTHFYDEREIELNFDPEQVENQNQIQSLLAFIRDLAVALNKPATMTHAGNRENYLLRYQLRTNRFMIEGAELNSQVNH